MADLLQLNTLELDALRNDARTRTMRDTVG